jgi:hypothetical protein
MKVECCDFSAFFEKSTAFLQKKGSKETSLTSGSRLTAATAPRTESFFAAFFSKKAALPFRLR